MSDRAPVPPLALDRPNSYIGRSVPRPNARRLVQGRGHYTDDVAAPAGVLHAAFLRSPYAHARITHIDVAAAKAAPGVALVVTGAEIDQVCEPWVGVLSHFKGLRSATQHALAVDHVVWQGEPVVGVAALTRAMAEDALSLIEIAYAELPPVTDPDAALLPESPLIHPELGSNLAFALTVESGDAEAAFRDAHTVVSGDFRFGRHSPVTLEARSVLADFNPSERRLTVHQSTQTPYQMQDIYARHLGLPQANVHVIAKDVGGSFGMKLHVYGDEVATVAMSVILGRAVKFIADRLESFPSDIHARDHRVRARMAVAADGEITAMIVDDLTGVGAFSAYPRTSAVEGNQAIRLMGGPYKLRHYSGNLRVVFQNKAVMSQYRAVGHPIACGVTEALVDQAAAAIGLDPLEFRRRNLLTDDVYPYTSPTGYLFERLSHHQCVDKLERLMDYPALRADQAEARTKGVVRGIGFAVFIEITNPGPAFYGVGGARITAQDGCVLTLEPSGNIRCAVSVTEQGQGTEAIMAQIAASAVGVRIEDVRVITGDTAATPYGGATWASRGAGIGGETVLITGKALRANLLRLAGILLQMPPDNLDISDGLIVDNATGRERITLQELARIAYYRPDTLPQGVQAELTAAHHHVPRGQPFAFTNGIQASHVEVDVESGFVRLLNHWVVEDCGRVINPLLVDEQIRGGVVQGIGAALFEECLYSEQGQLLNGTLADYLVPMASEMPDIHVDHVSTPTLHSELGAKGVGEAGTAGAAAAVLNAINDALQPFGARLSQMPATPERILRALGKLAG
ncbi:MAG: xanthine dehydrogenase family protein [Proteobacteria bacterium]|nr:xanthine dehydrogenase family protein [Pseudomonadota bacterium]